MRGCGCPTPRTTSARSHATSGYASPPFAWDAEDRRQCRARLDALYFRWYGLDRDEAAYALDTLSIVREHGEATFNRYPTKERVLGLDERARCRRHDDRAGAVGQIPDRISFVSMIAIDSGYAMPLPSAHTRPPEIGAMTVLRDEQRITPPASPAETELARTSRRLLAACIGRGPTARLRGRA